jgi:dTMP kinase
MTTRDHGLFIALEGGEGAGKTTQWNLLGDRFLTHEVTHLMTREPGGTPVGASIRGILLDPNSTLAPRTEALLFAADRAEHVASVIDPALAAGSVVVTDRYLASTIAYQSAARGLNPDEVAHLSHWGTNTLLPDLTILLDLPVEVGMSRVDARNAGTDRMEQAGQVFHQKVREGFLAWAEQAPRGTVHIVDATATPERIADQVWDLVWQHTLTWFQRGKLTNPKASV